MTYKKFFCDLIDHILQDTFKKSTQLPVTSFNSIQSMAKYARRLSFPSKVQDLHRILLEKVTQILRIRRLDVPSEQSTKKDLKRQGLVGLFKSSVRRDFIDRIVLEEIVEESLEWQDFSTQTTAIIDHLSRDLFDDILNHFVQNYIL
jgi:hypothetical protein